MKKKTTAGIAGIAGIALAAALSACSPGTGPDGEMPQFDSEHRQACYTQQGKFKKYDDDCWDDGLLTRSERDRKFPKVTPVKTSGGLKTSGPLKPVTGSTKKTSTGTGSTGIGSSKRK